MKTAFLGITEAIVAVLTAQLGNQVRITQADDRPIPDREVEAVNVQFNAGVPEGALLGAPVDWNSRFTIDLYARTTTQTPDVAIDQLLFRVHSAIAADPSLGGAATDTGTPVIEAEYSSDGKKTGWVRMTYPVQHRTASFTLEKA
ncbi:MAG: hypothetical protein K2X55_28150 [Burkholderiaceae bacterium]|nr:hypothetical protein [Burkholderiaceae bacterium]